MSPAHRRSVSRRSVMKTMAGAAMLGSAAACAPLPADSPTFVRPYSRKSFAVPRVSMDAVMRVITGQRPYRPQGFVVRSESMVDKTIVHNYGHGGSGLTLSWGSSALAVREVVGRRPGDVAVLGSGIMGLTSARLLQDAGWHPTIYTRDTYRHTTSNIAAGEWGPFGVADPALASDAFKSQLAWAARVSHHAYTNLTGPKYGIRWLESYALEDAPTSLYGEGSGFEDVLPYRRQYGPGEHPFPSAYAQVSVTMQMDPGTLLRQLVQDFQLAGGKFVIRNFGDVADVLSLAEPVVFNCTGLGSRELFGDEDLVPTKGQLVFLPPDPAVDYMTFGGGRGFLHMFPRADVLLLGGIYKPNDYTTHVEPDETERIVGEHQRLFAEFAGA